MSSLGRHADLSRHRHSSADGRWQRPTICRQRQAPPSIQLSGAGPSPAAERHCIGRGGSKSREIVSYSQRLQTTTTTTRRNSVPLSSAHHSFTKPLSHQSLTASLIIIHISQLLFTFIKQPRNGATASARLSLTLASSPGIEPDRTIQGRLWTGPKTAVIVVAAPQRARNESRRGPRDSSKRRPEPP